jgi:uncharacterized protein (UPF0332 family)
MTDDPTKALVKYRIERAEETYKEALLMRTEDHWNACANRLYYACFYAVSALLVKYNQLFEARQEGDYVDFVSFDRDLVEPWVLKVKEFIDDIKHHCEN